MPSAIRIRKIEDRIRDELAEMFLYEIEDPRLSGVMVTGVKVDRELEYASIYVSAVEGMERSVEVLAALTSAAGYIRRGRSICASFRGCASIGTRRPKTQRGWKNCSMRSNGSGSKRVSMVELTRARRTKEPPAETVSVCFLNWKNGSE